MRRMPRPARLRTIVLLGVVVAALVALPTAAHAADPPPSAISGVVTDASNGIHLPHIGVTLMRPDGSGGWTWYTNTSTDHDGVFDFSGLPDDDYVVYFDSSGYYNGLYPAEYWNDKATQGEADPIAIDSATGRDDINAALMRQTGTGSGASISGRVTDANEGWPVREARVELYYDGGGDWYYRDMTYSGGDGYYIFAGLPADTYALCFSDGYSRYLTTYYASRPDLDSADPIEIAADEDATEFDQALSPQPYAITGTVADVTTGDPIADAYCELYRYSGSSWDYYNYQYADAFGHYRFTSLPEGSYRLLFADIEDRYLPEYWQDASVLADATTITLDAATPVASGIDPLLRLGGIVSGTVTAEDTGDPIESVSVSLYRYNEAADEWDYAANRGTDSLGRYELVRLTDGIYRVHFWDWSKNFLPEYYDDAPGLLSATDLQVSVTPLTGRDAQLARGARISGTVTSDGTPDGIEGAYVRPFRYDESSGSWQDDGEHAVFTDATGAFNVTGLRFGTYRFSASAGGYVTEFWDDAEIVEDGTSRSLPDATQQTGVSFDLVRTGSVSGQVTDLGASPLSNITVRLYRLRYDSSGTAYWSGAYVAYTDTGGAYTIGAVTPGTYVLAFEDNNGVPPQYLREYYNGKPNPWASDTVTIGAGQAVTSMNAQLSVGGSISGTVRDTGGSPIGSVYVRAFAYDPSEDDWEGFGSAVYTSGSGTYTLTGLADDTYRIGFARSGYAHQYYNDAGTVFDAQDLTINGGAALTGKDAVLYPAEPAGTGTISGTVTEDGTGLPLQNVYVIAWRSSPLDYSDGWYHYTSAHTSASGVYTLSSLPPGIYRLEFRDGTGTYAHLSEFYDDATVAANGAHVRVLAGETVDADAGLARAGTISGTVTSSATGLPIESTSITAFTRAGIDWYWVSSTGTDANGDYTIGGLRGGDYQIHFNAGSQGYIDEYYEDARSLGAATSLSVSAGGALTDIDAGLDPYGTISGTVTGDDARPVEGITVSVYERMPDYWRVFTSCDTAPDGSYEIGQLEAGEYTLGFADAGAWGFERYSPEYHADAERLSDATLFPVDGDHTTVDATLASTGTWGDIAGAVTDPVGGVPVPGMAVVLYEPDGGGGWQQATRPPAVTGADGSYSLQWVPAGTGYRVAADPDTAVGYETPWSGIYQLTYHEDALDVSTALPVGVTAGAATPDVDILAQPEAGIGYLSAHVVEDGTGADIAGVTVTLWRDDGGWTEYATLETDADGRFFRPVAAGTYAVGFEHYPLHASEFYEDLDSGTPQDATPVEVTSGATSSITASLAPLGTISGTVTAEGSGVPLSGISVEAYLSDGAGGLYWAESATTGTDGTYTIRGLRYGEHYVGFTDQQWVYIFEAWNDRPDLQHADPVTVGAAPATGINASLLRGGSISGTVTDAETGDPVTGAWCAAYRYVPSSFGWDQVSSTPSGPDGTYTIGALPTDTYRVVISASGYAQEYYDDVRALPDAAKLDVVAGGSVTGINAALERYGSISGRLTAVTTGDPLTSAYAIAYRQQLSTGDWDWARSDMTDSSGNYQLGSLDPDTYRLYFYGSGYISEYYHDAYTVSAGQDVPLGAGEDLTGYDEALSTGTSISGTLRNAGGDPVSNVVAYALRYDPEYGVWKPANSAYSNSSGQYTLAGLGDAEYRVSFWDPYNRYATEFYADSPTIGGASPVVVAGGTPRAGIDATLGAKTPAAQGTIEGVVRDAASAAVLPGIYVETYRFAPHNGEWTNADGTYTDATGHYQFTTDVGIYHVRFHDEDGDYLTEFYHDVFTDNWDATELEVTEGAVTTANEGLSAASRITGTVTAADGGTPLPGIVATVYRVDPEAGYDWAANTETAADGTYEAAGLPAGTYFVEFSDPVQSYLGEYHDDVREAGEAEWIVLGAGAAASGIDAALDRAGLIEGTVTADDTGRPVENCRVQLYKQLPGSSAYHAQTTWTDDDGFYQFRGLEPATYYLEFLDQDSPTGYTRFVTEFHLDAVALGAATPIPIDAQTETVDAALASTDTWGSITGSVTDSLSGGGVPAMRLDLYKWNGSAFVSAGMSTYSGADGSYEFPYVAELAGGAPYRVLAAADAGAWASVYAPTAHLDAATVDLGTNVPVAGGTYLAGVDVHMQRLAGVGWIGGTVTTDAGGAPLGGIEVTYYTSDWSEAGAVTTAADGTYGRALQPGSYYLRFKDPAGAYATEYHDDSSWGDAVTVALGVGGTVDVDASLAAAAHISGAVRDSAGDPVDTTAYLYEAATWDYIGSATCSGGRYSFDGLRAGDYIVWFSSYGDLLGEYWDDRSLEGDTISVAAGQTRSDIDAVLMQGGRISGTVSADDGGLVNSVYVVTYSEEPSGWSWIDGVWAYPGSGWAFETSALLPGPYRLGFTDAGGDYAALFHDGALELSGAASVTVTEGGDTPVGLVFDGLPPAVGHDGVAEYDDIASIEITATDLTTGVETVSYELDGATVVDVPGAVASVTATGWGDHTLRYRAADRLGQWSDWAEHAFRINDTLPPEVSSDALALYDETPVTVTIAATDAEGGSGVDWISYRLDGAPAVTVASDSVPVEIAGYGDHTLEYWATDVAANESSHATDEITIGDLIAPTADDDAQTTYDDSAVIHLTADDNVAVDHISYRVDGGAWVNVPGDAATVTVTELGEHELEYRAFDTSDNSSPLYSVAFTVLRAGAVEEVPIAGDNRYLTAVEISKQAFPTGAGWVVVATGANWPDALGGSALAGALDGPILLTATDALPDAVRAEIGRLRASKAIILGGTSAVSTGVETALNGLLGEANVDRIGGADRYRTADLAAARTIAELGGAYDGTAFVATGANYPDALAAAPLSAGLHWPLFLTRPTGIDAGTTAAMAGVDEVLILGGEAVVPPAIENALEGRYGDANVMRLAGDDRYGTAVVVATHGVANGLEWDRLAIATGEQFPDALAGGVLQGRDGSVMLLTRSTVLAPAVAGVLQDNKDGIGEVRYLGGLKAVTQAVRDAVMAILE